MDDDRLQAAVQVLINKHGANVDVYVAKMADKALLEGDVVEHVMWALIANAIERLNKEAEGKKLQ